MSAIYRRARPTQWSDVVGQQHVKSVLQEALRQGKIGHAYIFSGPRGVGKTTVARLIAMAASCTSTKADKPCGVCENCQLTAAGHHPDVEEIDAASNNGVDSMRALRERLQMSSLRGGSRVYILDETHMLSNAAANAFLKTLEEPPPGVIFVLATTEPEKLLPTIVSRCQHYRFRRLTPEEIAGKLKKLVEKEGASATDEALALMGRLADGAMRDGESLLERMLAGADSFDLQDVENALGLPPAERSLGMAEALMNADGIALLEIARSMYGAGFAAATILQGVSESFSNLVGQAVDKRDNARALELLRAQNALDGQRLDASADLLGLELALGHALMTLQQPAAASAAPAQSAPPPAASAEHSTLLRQLQGEIEQLKREMRDMKLQGARPAPAPAAMAASGALGATERGKFIEAVPKEGRKSIKDVLFDLFLESDVLRIDFRDDGPFQLFSKRPPLAEHLRQGAKKAFGVQALHLSHDGASFRADGSASAQIATPPPQLQPPASRQPQAATPPQIQPQVQPEAQRTSPKRGSPPDQFDRPPDSAYENIAPSDHDAGYAYTESDEAFLRGELPLPEPPSTEDAPPMKDGPTPSAPPFASHASVPSVKVATGLQSLLRGARLENQFTSAAVPSAEESDEDEALSTEEADPEGD